jgi:hypothetical protein
VGRHRTRSLVVYIFLALAGCRTPAAETKPSTVIPIASAPSAAIRVEPPPRPPPRSRVVVTTFGDGGLKHALWSVASDGTVKPIVFPADGLAGTVAPGYGSDGPLPSPDGKWVSYKDGGRRGGHLVVRNVETGETVIVATNGPKSEMVAVDWSVRGDRLLWSTATVEGADGILGDDAVWEFLVKCKLPKAWGDGAQFRVGDSGAVAFVMNHDVVIAAPGADRPKAITHGGRFAEYQFPKPSPSGIHVAYEHQLDHGTGKRVRINLAVDGKTIAEEVGGYDWIDDETIAVSKYDPSPPVVNRLEAPMREAR